MGDVLGKKNEVAGKKLLNAIAVPPSVNVPSPAIWIEPFIGIGFAEARLLTPRATATVASIFRNEVFTFLFFLF